MAHNDIIYILIIYIRVIIWGDLGPGPKRMISTSLEVEFCIDSKSRSPTFVLCLVGPQKAVYRAHTNKPNFPMLSLKLNHIRNLKGNLNIQVPSPDSACSTCYTQNGVRVLGEGLVILFNWIVSNCV